MNIEGLEKLVIRWASARNIYAQSTDVTRLEKLKKEVRELEEAVMKGDEGDICLEAGDVAAALINLLHPLGLDLGTCLNAAYNKIKCRKGRMVNGMFVKEADLVKTREGIL
jgi:NTP pyrophosphatase (non-canonical NTP hydrolase)